jgi:hypothetical protein
MSEKLNQILDEAFDKYEAIINNQSAMITKLQAERKLLHRLFDGCVKEILDLITNSATLMEKDTIPSNLVLEIIERHVNKLKEL